MKVKDFKYLVLLNLCIFATPSSAQTKDDITFRVDGSMADLYAYRLQGIFDSRYSHVSRESIDADYQDGGSFSKNQRQQGVLIYEPLDILYKNPRSISKREVQEKVNNIAQITAGKYPQYFSINLRQEFDRRTIETYSDIMAIYEERLTIIFDRINEAYGGHLQSWVNHGTNEFFWSEDEWASAMKVADRRFTWLCENDLDEVAQKKLKFFTTAMRISEKNFCKYLQEKEKGTPWAVNFMMDFARSIYTLNPNRFSDGARPFLIPNVPEIMFHFSLPIPDRSSFRGAALNIKYPESFEDAVDLAVAQIELDALFAVQFSVEPPVPFEFYRQYLATNAEKLLFNDIRKTSDVEDRIVSANISLEDFDLMKKILYVDSLTDQQRKVLSVYDSSFANNMQGLQDRQKNAIAARKKEREESDRANEFAGKTQEYQSQFFHIATLEACYEARKNYLVPYITIDQIKSARQNWTEKQASMTLPRELWDDAESELQSGELLSFS